MTTDPASTLPALTLNERRVLGTLVEKQKTSKSADAYPLTLNSLVLGCNQKSNRDPVLDLTDDDVSETLEGLQRAGLVTCLQGGRAERWRHELYTAWRVSKIELAVLAELLLRGAQTEGELRQRASRMEPIDDLDALRELLRPLAERKLVIYLTPEGRRGTMLTHGFLSPGDLTREKARAASVSLDAEAAPSAAPAPRSEPAADRLAPLEARLQRAETEITSLRTTVANLQSALTALQEQLGVSSPPPA
jgi:uncharacterized protein YceH (UPF0502 family)